MYENRLLCLITLSVVFIPAIYTTFLILKKIRIKTAFIYYYYIKNIYEFQTYNFK